MVRQLRFLRSEQGVTLVETIVAAVLIAILFTLTYPVFVDMLRNWSRNEEEAKMASDAMIATANLEKDIRESDQCLVDTANFNLLDVRYTGKRVLYFLEGDSLMRTEEEEDSGAWREVSRRTVASGVQNLEFQLVDDGTTNVGVKVQITFGSGTRLFSVASIIHWRN